MMKFMEFDNLPNTIALIPDGNRRWAKAHKLSILSSYSKGVNKFIEFSEWCMDYGINSIAVWAFSVENLSRDRREVNALFNIYKRVANDSSIIERLHRNQARLNIIGNTRLLPRGLLISLRNIEKETRRYKDRAINMLISYGGKDDILHAVKKAVKNAKNAARLDEELFRRYLLSNAMPEIDFVIRTSGEQRLSGFLPWQTGYSELYFSDKLWPDFTKEDLHSALLDYNRRQRRFGR